MFNKIIFKKLACYLAPKKKFLLLNFLFHPKTNDFTQKKTKKKKTFEIVTKKGLNICHKYKVSAFKIIIVMY